MMYSNLKFWVFSLLGVSLLLLGGCRAPWAMEQKEVVRKMSETMSTLESVKISKADIEARGLFISPEDYVEYIDGETPSPSVNGTLALEVSGQTKTLYTSPQPDYMLTAKGTLKIDEDVYPYSVESRGKGPLVYLNFLQLPGFVKSMDFTALTNKWWELPRSQGGAFYMPVPTVDPKTTEKDVEDLEDEEPEEFTEEQLKELENLIATTYLFTVVQDYGKEKCENEEKAYHYKVKLDEEAGKEFYLSYAEILGEPITTQELDDLEEMLKVLAALDIDVWIQKDGFFLCQFTATGNYKNIENQQTYQISVKAHLSDFNSPFKVEAQSDAEPLTVENILETMNLDIDSLKKILQEGVESDEFMKTLQDVKEEVKKIFNR